MGKLSKRSLTNLDGVHEDLVKVVQLASKKANFLVTEGVRSKERQAMLVKAGKSQTRNSRHLYGLAVDLCDTDGCYDLPDMRAISKAMKEAADELKVPLVWGGDWKRFKDTPHFELDRRHYPDTGDRKPWVMKPSDPVVAVGTGAAAGGATVAPSVPSILPDLSALQSTSEQLLMFVKSPALGAVAALVLIYYFAAPKILARLT